MASNSVQLGCANTSYKYTLSVDWSESETNIANNTTKISANGYLSASNVGFDALYDSYACHLKLYWHDDNNGKDVLFATSSAFTTCGMGYGTRSVSGSITVTHKSDGSLSGYVYVWFEAPTNAGGWSPSSSTCSTSWVNCTTIARASGITSVVSPSEYLGQSVTVTIDRKSSDFVHNVQYSFENSPWVVVSTNATTSCTFTPSKDLARYIPKSVTGTLKVCVGTFKGNTQIGDWVYSSITLWASADSKPYISGLSLELVSNGAPSAFNGIYIQGKSKVKATIGSITQSYGSPIKSYRITGPGLDIYDSSGTSDVLTSSGKLTYTCTVTDYRGRSYSTTNYINVEEYYTPSVSIAKAIRCKSDGTPNNDGTYLNVIMNYSCASINDTKGNPTNYISSKSCICNGVSVTSIASGTAFVIAANCDIGKQYTLTASVTDLFGRTATVTTTISTAFCILNVNKSKTGLAIGKYSEKDAFEVNMDSYLYGNIRVSHNLSFDGMLAPSDVKNGGGSSDAFMHLCRIKISKLYANQPIEICYQQRGSYSNTILCLMFESVNSTDPNIYSFRYKGYCRGAYIVKSATSTWDIYIKKSQPWEDIAILYWSYISSEITLDKYMVNASTLPSGYITAVDFYLENLRDKMFPVGAVYITYNNNNPGNFLGGTWVQFGQGRTLIGQGTGNDGSTSMSFTTAGDTGGKYKTSHSHTTSFGWDNNAFFAGKPDGAANNNYSRTSVVSNGYVIQASSSPTSASRLNWTEDISINHIQPYVTIYFWRRTA